MKKQGLQPRAINSMPYANAYGMPANGTAGFAAALPLAQPRMNMPLAAAVPFGWQPPIALGRAP